MSEKLTISFSEIIQQGDEFLEQKKFENAYKLYEKALSAEPESPAAYYKLGYACLYLDKVEEAENHFQNTVSLDPNSHWGYYGLGLVLLERKKWKEAEYFLQKAREINKNFYGTYVLLGDLFARAQNLDQAIIYYQRVLEIKPEHELIRERRDDLIKLKTGHIKTKNKSKEINENKKTDQFTRSNFSKILDNAIQLINSNPKLYGVDIPMESTKYLDDQNFNSDKIQAQLEKIRHRVSRNYQDKPVDGLLAEIATLQLGISELNLQLKILSSRLFLRDALLPELSDPDSSVTTRNLTIEASYPLSPEQGFYHPEYGKNGDHFRWTGPKPIFYFDLYIDRSVMLDLKLFLLGMGNDENVVGLECFADSTKLLLKHEEEQGFQTLSGVLPERDAFGCTRLSFIVPNLKIPSEKDPENEDKRELGVAFSKLIIQPSEINSK